METSLQGLSPLRESSLFGGEQETAPVETGGFGNIFQSAVSAVREADAELTQAEYLMATGQLDNPASLTIASTKAQLSVDLLVQLRNKALESYNELMRISL